MMKYILMIACISSILTLAACSNTMNGFQSDWRNNSQKVSNDLNR